MQASLFAHATPAVAMINLKQESLEDKVLKATTAILALFEKRQIVCVSFSGGKDSSVLMHLVLEAAKKAQQLGYQPRVEVFSSDTRVENPEIAQLLRREHLKIQTAFQALGIDSAIHLTQPSLATSWAVRILSGNKLPSFPGSTHDCAMDFKVSPIRSARKQAFKRLGKSNIVTLIGTRFEESAERSRNMIERGELAHTPYINEEQEQVMSPIAFWTSDDVWELIGLIRVGMVGSYSDFEDTFKLYADAGGTSCAVVSDAITEGVKKARGGCGARFGCYVCVAVANDASLDTMIETDDKYAYMKGLNQLRTLLVKTRWDFSKRYWVQRSIGSDGCIQLQPDCYSPAFLLELFRYCASLDKLEQRAAAKARIAPRFQILDEGTVVAIDALWSLNGMHPAHTALLEWLAIMQGLRLYAIPNSTDIVDAPRTAVPTALRYPVGDTWEGSDFSLFGGMRDAMTAFSDCTETIESNDGRSLLVIETEKRMDVDMESFYLAIEFELDKIEARHEESKRTGCWTTGYQFWVQYGTLILSPTQVAEHDMFLRRTAWRVQQGLQGEQGNLIAQQMVKESQGEQSTLQGTFAFFNR